MFRSSHLQLQEPVKITLGTQRKPVGRGSKRRLVEKEEGFVYIPILQTLETLLDDEGIMAEVSTDRLYQLVIVFLSCLYLAQQVLSSLTFILLCTITHVGDERASELWGDTLRLL